MAKSRNSQLDYGISNPGEMPLVSVCIPTYRDAHFLSQCLDSIISQTYRNLEILVGDDASPDDTDEIVRSYKDARIRYLRNPQNLGQFENINHLISQARGSYIAIYHSDDYYHPNIVLEEVTFLEAHSEVGAVFALDWRVDDHGRITGKMKLLPELPLDTALTLSDILPILLRNRNRVFRTPTFMGRSTVLHLAGPFSSDYDIVGDFEMWLRIARLSPVAILDDFLMYYRRGSSQVSSSYERLRTYEDHFFVIMDHYLNLVPPETAVDPLDLVEYCYHRRADETYRAVNLICMGRLQEARELLGRSFPWRTFFISTPGLHVRKLSVLLKRVLLKLGLAIGAVWLLTRLVRRSANDSENEFLAR